VDPITESLLAIKGDQQERLNRYALNWAFYRGKQYVHEMGMEYAKEHKLFKEMRKVFGFVTQTVDTDARLVMKRQLRIKAEKENFADDIYDIWERSNIQAEKYKLVRYGANLGDAYLIVQDLSDGIGKVVPRIIVANSEDMYVEQDPDDQTNVLWARQSYTFIDERNVPHTRDWLYWPDRVERYTDYKMDEGYPISHPFNEVPVIHIKTLDIGEKWGLCSWHNVQSQIDYVNELGSFANKIMLRYADPTLVGVGISPGTSIPIRRGINSDNIYYLSNPESDLRILEYQGNVLPQMMDMIKEISANIKDQLPELSLTKLRDSSQLSGYAVSLHLADLIAKVEELRGNFANGIEWANSLCLRALKRSDAPLEEFENHVVYEDILPEDLQLKLTSYGQMLAMRIESRKGILLRQGLTEEEAEAKLQEIDEEAMADYDTFFLQNRDSEAEEEEEEE